MSPPPGLPPADGGRPSAPGVDPAPLERLCRLAVDTLGADGAVIHVLSTDGMGQVAACWGDSAHDAAEMEFDLGEGPGRDAFATGVPVLVPDVMEAFDRWPGLAGAAAQSGLWSIYAYPIQVGAAHLGVLTLYGRRPHQLSEASLRAGSTLADRGVDLLLDRFEPRTQIVGTRPPGASAREPDGGQLDEHQNGRFNGRQNGRLDGHQNGGRPNGHQHGRLDGRRNGEPGGEPAQVYRLQLQHEEVYQAQGMVMVDLDVSLSEALARLRGHAYAADRSLADVAHDIVQGRLRLTPTASDPGPEEPDA